jgi:hypothetical protein
MGKKSSREPTGNLKNTKEKGSKEQQKETKAEEQKSVPAKAQSGRRFSIVVWGATGFTGALVCKHIAEVYKVLFLNTTPVAIIPLFPYTHDRCTANGVPRACSWLVTFTCVHIRSLQKQHRSVCGRSMLSDMQTYCHARDGLAAEEEAFGHGGTTHEKRTQSLTR